MCVCVWQELESSIYDTLRASCEQFGGVSRETFISTLMHFFREADDAVDKITNLQAAAPPNPCRQLFAMHSAEPVLHRRSLRAVDAEGGSPSCAAQLMWFLRMLHYEVRPLASCFGY